MTEHDQKHEDEDVEEQGARFSGRDDEPAEAETEGSGDESEVDEQRFNAGSDALLKRSIEACRSLL